MYGFGNFIQGGPKDIDWFYRAWKNKYIFIFSSYIRKNIGQRCSDYLAYKIFIMV